jgi:beta-N-acetylhexosaminidase
MVAQMSEDDKLGQLLIMQFTADTYTPTQQQMVRSYHPGGVVFERNAMGTAQQVKALLASGQQDSAIPMFTFLQMEGGIIDPLAHYLGPNPSPSEIVASGNTAFAQSEGSKIAKELLSFGFNADLGPNLNVGTSTDSQSFGDTAAQVTSFGGSWLMGLQNSSVVGCALDFPSILGPLDLAPYRTLINSGQLQMVMASTAVIPSLDPSLPAALSGRIVTGLLRGELQFTGVVITDELILSSVARRFLLPQAAVMAIEAGADMISGVSNPTTMRSVIAALKAAIAAGKLSQQQVDASVTRILALKLRYQIITTPNNATTGP